MNTWVVTVELCIDGLWKPERVLQVEASSPQVAVARGVKEAVRLAGVPWRSRRMSSVTVQARRLS